MPHSLPPTPTFLIAGGGSGGHISPGLAIAERLEPAEVVFACSTREIDARMLSHAQADYIRLPAVPPSPHPLRMIRFIAEFRRSKRICRDLIRRRSVDHVIALGGFVSAPAVSAARACGIPATLINLDDPPGKANRFVARRCRQVWSAIPLSTMPRFAERIVGMPLRRCAIAEKDQAESRKTLGIDPDRPTLFVTGASQGATSVNSFLTAIAEADPAIFDSWQIYHLSGRGAGESLRAAYDRAGVNATVEEFLDEIGPAWGAADLVISRAGANSVAEAAANATPTLFMPYPYHRDMHQENNARPLLEIGGVVIARDHVQPEENITHIGPVLRSLMEDAPRRQAMKEQLLAHHPANGADTIATLLLDGR